MTTTPLIEARRRDVQQRRHRVEEALARLAQAGEDITISAVADAARVHRSFIHRHADLRARIVSAAEEPTHPSALATTVSRRSLEAENLNLRQSNHRLQTAISELESRLSELLGEQAFRRTGLGSPKAQSDLEHQVVGLEQRVLDLQRALDERDEELAAAREAHRRLMATVNKQ